MNQRFEAPVRKTDVPYAQAEGICRARGGTRTALPALKHGERAKTYGIRRNPRTLRGSSGRKVWTMSTPSFEPNFSNLVVILWENPPPDYRRPETPKYQWPAKDSTRMALTLRHVSQGVPGSVTVYAVGGLLKRVQADYPCTSGSLPRERHGSADQGERDLGDQSIRKGYPRELIRPEPMTEGWARVTAAFWLVWSATADAAAFPPVYLDHWGRQLESRS